MPATQRRITDRVTHRAQAPLDGLPLINLDADVDVPSTKEKFSRFIELAHARTWPTVSPLCSALQCYLEYWSCVFRMLLTMLG